MGLSWLFFWRKKTKKLDINKRRRIYIGEVVEVEDEETNGVGGNNSAKNTEKVPSDPIIKRRNSSNASHSGKVKTEVPKYGKNQGFPSNKIVSSRYTLLSFFPKQLYEQLRRIVNDYFVIMVCIQAFSDSPVSPVTTATPLIFVVVVSAIKQGYEDWLRHKADSLVNNRLVNIVRDGKLVPIKAKELVVGDIVRVEGEEQAVADLLVLGSSDEFSRCQLSTSNLDGETNLKIRYCPAGLPSLKNEESFSKLHAIIECDQPSNDLYSFTGTILIPYDKMSHSDDEDLLTPPSPDHSKFKLKKVRSNGSRKSQTKVEEAKSNNSNLSKGSKTSQKSKSNIHSISNFRQVAISMDNIALRGTRIKNTDFIYGVVIYTGKETRMALNSDIQNTKFSSVEVSVNRYLAFYITLLISLVIVCTSLHFITLKTDSLDPFKLWYIYWNDFEIDTYYMFNTFAMFLILFNYIIPISLYVTMELQKFFGSKFFVWDNDMRCPVTGQAPLCNTSDLNEELGQIQYLFSDKTGTLTENVMQFRHCSVNELRYDLRGDLLYLVDDSQGLNDQVEPSKSLELTNFLRILALCHTVQLVPHRRPSFDVAGAFSTKKLITSKMKAASSLFTMEPEVKNIPGAEPNLVMQASSPDEKALLEACSKLGVVYLGEKKDMLTIEVFGKTEVYKRHYILEFDADRKCMSVIVENSKGEIWLFTKGAESSIVSKSDIGPIHETMKHIVDFAMMGMRTLAVAERKLTKAELSEFSSRINATRRIVENREHNMRLIYQNLESHLTLVGATGVEDQLQDNVPETLQSLSAAGIHIWMLTGDKVETAVNVSVSCGLVTPATTQLYLTGIQTEEELKRRMREIDEEIREGENTTLIIDGPSLALAFVFSPQLLQTMSMRAYRVVCCRMAPLQKSKVVEMVKNSPSKPVTAAIGDGANDVAMILAAHIGIGIFGKEGRQAARSSDFAFARFKFLKKAILVHGHWYYVRLSYLAMYFFYKNLVFVLPQFFYAFDAGFSGNTLYTSFFLTVYNIFYTSVPIFAYGLQEQPYSCKTLLANPSLYRKLTKNSYLSWKSFLVWHILAIYHSLVIYFIPRTVWQTVNPDINDAQCFGVLIYCSLISVVHLKSLVFTHFISMWTWISIGLSFGVLFVFTSIFSEINFHLASGSTYNQGQFTGVFFRLMSYPDFWFVIVIIVILALIPDITIKALYNSWPGILRIRRKWKGFIKEMKTIKTNRNSFHMPPPVSLLFSKRSGKITISSIRFNSYFSNPDEGLRRS